MAQPIEAFRNALKIPELKQRIIFTMVALLVYRLGSHVPTPGVNGQPGTNASWNGALEVLP